MKPTERKGAPPHLQVTTREGTVKWGSRLHFTFDLAVGGIIVDCTCWPLVTQETMPASCHLSRRMSHVLCLVTGLGSSWQVTLEAWADLRAASLRKERNKGLRENNRSWLACLRGLFSSGDWQREVSVAETCSQIFFFSFNLTLLIPVCFCHPSLSLLLCVYEYV